MAITLKKKRELNNPHEGRKSRKITIAELENMHLLTCEKKEVENPMTLATTP